MTVPLILLAIASALIGLAVGLPFEGGLMHTWLDPVFHHATETLGIHHEAFQIAGIDGALLILGAVAGAIGVAFAIWLFGIFRRGGARERVERLTDRLRPLYNASYAKWWFDDLNDVIFVRIGGGVARAIWWFDVRVVDGTVNGIATLTQSTGRGIRTIQTGRVQNYALGIAAGLLVFAVTYLFVIAK
jgi:NADH-quinone oxidoreductase subunit L